MSWRTALCLMCVTGCALPANEAPPAALNVTTKRLVPPRLSEAERRDIAQGLLVKKKTVLFRNGRKYVGGLSFQLVNATPAVVLQEIFSTEAALWWMPQTLSARAVGGSGRDLMVRFEQGEKPFVATHTLHIWRDDLAIRWKLDPRQHHDIEDAWGFLSATPFGEGRSLVTLGIQLDLGDGVVRAFAEADIQDTVLGTPRDIKDYVETRHPG
jgi:hypothetical protein